MYVEMLYGNEKGKEDIVNMILGVKTDFKKIKIMEPPIDLGYGLRFNFIGEYENEKIDEENSIDILENDIRFTDMIYAAVLDVFGHERAMDYFNWFVGKYFSSVAGCTGAAV